MTHLRNSYAALAARSAVDLRVHCTATAAVSNKTRPSPIKLGAGPILSAIQPKPVMPAMADAIDPTLNVVRTRPIKCSGVTSCRSAQTMGLSTAVLPPHDDDESRSDERHFH